MNLVADVGRSIQVGRTLKNPDEIGWGSFPATHPNRKTMPSTIAVRRRLTGELLANPALLSLSDRMLCRDARSRFKVGRRTAESAVAAARQKCRCNISGAATPAPIHHTSVSTPEVSWEGASG